MRLMLICHGATAATRRAAFPVDEPVEPAALSGATPVGRVDHAVRGPALRCAQTASALGIEAEIDERLRDCDYGDWAGRRLDEVARTDPDALTRWLTDPVATPPGGESVAELLDRVGGWLDEREPNGTVAVTHPAVIKAALVHALQARPESFWRMDIAPLSRTELRGGPGRWTLHWLTR